MSIRAVLYIRTHGLDSNQAIQEARRVASVDTATARRQLADLVSRVRYTKERITLTRYGKPFAVLVPVEDLVALRKRGGRGPARSPNKLR